MQRARNDRDVFIVARAREKIAPRADNWRHIATVTILIGQDRGKIGTYDRPNYRSKQNVLACVMVAPAIVEEEID